MALLELDLGDNGGKVIFENETDLQTWIQAERQEWIWLVGNNDSRSCARARDLINEALNRHNQQADDLIRFIRTNGAGKPIDQQRLERVKSIIESDYHAVKLFSPPSSIGQYLQRIRAQNPFQASYALAYFLKEDTPAVSLNSAEGVRGFIGAMLWDQVSRDTSEQFQKEIDATRTEWLALIAEAKAARGNWQTEVTDTKANLQKDYADLRTKIDHDFRTISATEEPATFWNRKRWWHYGLAAVWGLVTIAVGGAGGAWLFSLAKGLAADTATAEKYLQAIPHILPVAIVLVGLYWIIRILIRLFLSNLHIGQDAAERVLIIKTFQALAASPSKDVIGKELATVLWAQVFRHCPSGLVKDEAEPQIPASLLTNLKG